MKVLLIIEIAIALGISIYEAYKYYNKRTNELKEDSQGDGDDADADGESVIYKL